MKKTSIAHFHSISRIFSFSVQEKCKMGGRGEFPRAQEWKFLRDRIKAEAPPSPGAQGTTSVCNGCEAVARRRSEGTHPINKTTRVTIEFNRRERTGSRRRSWTAAARQPGTGGPSGPRPEVNPRARIRHYCLLSRTSIPCGRDVGSRSRKERRTPTLEFVLLAKG